MHSQLFVLPLCTHCPVQELIHAEVSPEAVLTILSGGFMLST